MLNLTNVIINYLKGESVMEIEKRLTILQNTYAASVAETVNTYEKLKELETIVEKRKERQTQTAPVSYTHLHSYLRYLSHI